MASDLEKTTVYLEATDYRRVRDLASREHRPAAELIREAVSEYVRRRDSRVQPSSIGAGRSGRSDLSERAEELLSGFGDAS